MLSFILLKGVQRRQVLVVNFCWQVLVVNLFISLKLFFCFVVATFDLVHDVEAIFHLPLLLTASGNLF